MKKNIAKITLFSIVTAALVALPAVARAADATNAPAAETATPKKAHSTLPFHGKVAAVDATAMTLTVGTMTIGVSSETKIAKDGKPAVFSDLAVGDAVSGSYKKDAAGKMTAVKIKVGEAKKGEPKTEAPPASK